MTAPPHGADGSVPLARRCWDELSAQARRQGLSFRELEQRLRSGQPPNRAPSHTTLHDWFRKRPTLPDKLVFLALVRVLDLDEREWGQRWEEWDRARSVPQRGEVALVPTASDEDSDDDAAVHPERTAVEEPRPAPPRRARRLRVGAALAVTVVAALVVVAASTHGTGSGDTDLTGSITIDCATVVVDVAPVFDEPGTRDPVFVKRRGDPITSPRLRGEVIGPDGRPYRRVLTRRTPKGHAYMPADTLAPSNCSRVV